MQAKPNLRTPHGREFAVAVAEQDPMPLRLLGQGHAQVAACWTTQAPSGFDVTPAI
jgi:hypothetical protein